MVAHNPDTGVTRIKLPSGSKKVRCLTLFLVQWPASCQAGDWKVVHRLMDVLTTSWDMQGSG